MPAIRFFTEDISFKLSHKRNIKQWIKQCINKESHQLLELIYVFCSDKYLLEMNTSYLAHDTLTDIITFDHSETGNAIEGEIYISIDRVMENAKDRKLNFEDELYRVMIHGVLHLCGFKDKTDTEKFTMRNKENEYLNELINKQKS